MEEFIYKAIDSKGNIINGSMSAKSEAELIHILREKDQKPIEIVKKRKTSVLQKDIQLPFFKPKIKLLDLAIFSRQLATMLKAGLQLDRAMDIQIEQTYNPAMKQCLIKIGQDIKKGVSLSKSMELSKRFPTIFINTVKSGENTGDMDGCFERMAVHFERENMINRKIKGAMTYPSFIFIFTILISLGMLIFVLPKFADMFNDVDGELPGLTQALMNVSNSLVRFWYLYCLVVPGIIYLVYRYIHTKKGRYQLDSLKLKIPIVKKYIQQIITARFTRTLATMLQSGIGIIESLTMSAQTTNNTVVIKKIDDILIDLKKGASIATQMKNTGLFPTMMISFISIGEETGQLGDLLLKTAGYYDEEFNAAIDKLLNLIEPLMIVFMALIVGTIVLAMYLPMFSIYEYM